MKTKLWTALLLPMLGLGVVGCPERDPWEGCPQERRCLSGDIVTNEAKKCCPADQRCVGRDNPMEGGDCR